MKIGMPCFIVSFNCSYTIYDIIKRITETVKQHNNFRIIQVCNTSSQRIVIDTKSSGYIYYNSFQPIVNIEMININKKTQVFIIFELRKSTKILMMIFLLFILLFEIMMLIFCITSQLLTPILLCLPLGAMFFAYLLGTIGLYFSSREVLKILLVALDFDLSKCMPSLRYYTRQNKTGDGNKTGDDKTGDGTKPLKK